MRIHSPALPPHPHPPPPPPYPGTVVRLADGVEEGPTLGEDVDTATTAVHQVELVPAHTTYHTHTFEQRNLGPAPRAMVRNRIHFPSRIRMQEGKFSNKNYMNLKFSCPVTLILLI